MFLNLILRFVLEKELNLNGSLLTLWFRRLLLPPLRHPGLGGVILCLLGAGLSEAEAAMGEFYMNPHRLSFPTNYLNRSAWSNCRYVGLSLLAGF